MQVTWYQRVSFPLMFVDLGISTINLNLSGAIWYVLLQDFSSPLLQTGMGHPYIPCAYHWIYDICPSHHTLGGLTLFPDSTWSSFYWATIPHGLQELIALHLSPSLYTLSFLILSWIMLQVDSDFYKKWNMSKVYSCPQPTISINKWPWKGWSGIWYLIGALWRVYQKLHINHTRWVPRKVQMFFFQFWIFHD